MSRTGLLLGRPALLAAAFALVIAAVPLQSSAAPVDDAARRAAEEIQAARDRAQQIADQTFEAESQLDDLEIQLADTERQLAAEQAAVNELRADLSDVAVRRFTGGGVDNNPLLNGVDAANDNGTAAVFVGAATGSSLASVDDFDAAIDELESTRQVVASQRARTEAAREELVELQAAAEAEIIRLQELE